MLASRSILIALYGNATAVSYDLNNESTANLREVLLGSDPLGAGASAQVSSSRVRHLKDGAVTIGALSIMNYELSPTVIDARYPGRTAATKAAMSLPKVTM
jgi:hypothetical protein